ncbi:MAG: MarR family winged helix-turn-helix transcriptional regulator [Halioglobus sp.]
MNSPSPNTDFSPDIQLEYRDNFARHILRVTLYIQSEVMNTLMLKHDHSQLRTTYVPYITIAADRGARLSDIAEMLGISRQAANKTVNQIEAAGYLQRAADPSDARAKLLVTTPEAKAMIRQGGVEAMKLQNRFAEIVGDKELALANASIVQLIDQLDLSFPFESNKVPNLSAVLPRLSDFITGRLQSLTMAKGHPKLKRSFGSVLTAIGPAGGRIQQIANTRNVSKQAISAIASELEELGYIRRQPLPADVRQVVLLFTDKGQELIADGVASVHELAQAFSDLIGEHELQQLNEVMARIYRSLHLEHDIFDHADSNDIRIVARQVKRQLGEDGAKALARLLLSNDSNY